MAQVLVVDDEWLVAIDLQHCLERLGYSVMGPVPSVKDAMAALDEEDPDLAILDVNLDGQLSTPIAERLRASRIPFALATACTVSELGEPAYEGAPVLGKPMDICSLNTVLDGLSACWE